MDGYRLCHEIRTSGSAAAGVPFVLYTATFNTQADRQLAATMGADCYLLKPAATPGILAALGEAQLKARHRSQTPYERTDDDNVLREPLLSGTAPVTLTNVDLDEVFDAALTPIRHETQERSIQWQIQHHFLLQSPCSGSRLGRAAGHGENTDRR